MTPHIAPLFSDQPLEVGPPSAPDAGLGTLTTDRGNLPLDSVDVSARITGLAAGVEVVQGFRNPFDVPLEATYIFPLPDRAGLTAMRMEAADRVVEGTLKERGQARADYDAAIAAGRRAAIAEEDRPDVFTMRVGNILPGERVTITLKLSQPLPYEDDAATFRFPLVVAPRYIPGMPLDDAPAGDGVEPDTDAAPDASRISPPVLLPGFPNPIHLALSVDIDPAGLPLTEIRSSLHVVTTGEAGEGRMTIRLRPGERLNRDFILRLGFAPQEAASLTLTPDASGKEGTFTLTVLPPTAAANADTGAETTVTSGATATGATAGTGAAPGATTGAGNPWPRARDVALVLDRSGSMGGWKIVAARRAAARIIDTLTGEDRFAVLCFDHTVERPAGLAKGFSPATDRNRFRAVEHLARLEARGGTELLAPLQEAAGLLGEPAHPAVPGTPAYPAPPNPSGRDRVLVLITDGQVGNEDQILARIEPALSGVRVHTVGIDRAINAGFLGRLSAIGQGRFELVESEDRLDEAMEHIHHRIAAPMVTGLSLEADGLKLVPDTVTPSRLGALFPGVPLVIAGRWRGQATGALTVRGVATDGTPWRHRVAATVTDDPAATPIWARAQLRELEDRYVTRGSTSLEKRIVETSLRFGVLCRFTAFVAVDSRVVAEGGEGPHQVIQPVELPDGWAAAPPMMPSGMSPGMSPAAAYLPMAAPAESAPPPPPPAPMALRPPTPMAPGPVGGAMPRLGRMARSRRAGARLEESESRLVPDALALARRQLRQEAKRLTGLASAPQDARWRLLSDLRTRLDALLIHLRDSGVAEDTLAPLVSLLADLRAADEPARPPAISELWDRTVRVLTEFTDSKPSTKRAFWKKPR